MIIKSTYRLTFFIFLILTGFAFSQKNTNSIWENISKPRFSKNLKIDLSTETKFYKLNFSKLKESLDLAPSRDNVMTSKTEVIISFPNYKGEFIRFKVIEASVMSTELQSKFPNIKSYAGQSIDSPGEIIRFSVSEKKGITSFQRSSVDSDSFIEKYSDGDDVFAVFSRVNSEKSSFVCETEDIIVNKTKEKLNKTFKDADSGILHTFRLALSCTGEYGSGVGGGTVAGVMAEFNATITRVNGVFENDFSTTMVLVSNEEDIIHLNPSTDPYSGNVNNLNSEVQSHLTSVIGEANYDVGHVFNQSGNNGNAGCIGCICVDGRKGSAFTQSTFPKGVNFDIDYVAHELGHQFGGNHTFTHSDESGSNAQLEPGSGSTIMGYAGITGSTDVQPNSDPYFHFFSIEQVTNNVASKNCDTETILSQQEPQVDAGTNYTIPIGTAFKLTGSGVVDALGTISYCWEQNDKGSSSTTFPKPNAASGPSFRSYSPTLSPTRYFPRLPVVFGGSLGEEGDWEVISSVSRNYSFKLTVRDNIIGGGQNKIDDMSVFVDDSFGPFQVTSQENSTSWDVGTTETITWNVASTNEGAVNAKKINILFTDDQGVSFTTLASGVDNDGSHDIVVPNVITSSGRIMVEAADNIFFAVNSGFITVKEVEFVLDFSEDVKDLCSSEDEIDFEFIHKTFLGYAETTTFSVLNKPQGTTVTFNPVSSSLDGENVIMTISGISASNIGENTIVVQGISSVTGIIYNKTIILNIVNENLIRPAIISPLNNELGVQQPVSFSWENNVDVETYEIEIFDNADALGGPVVTASVSNNIYIADLLSDFTNYWWRVKGLNNCAVSEFSELFEFKTIDIDTDSDGVLDYIDNCVTVSNPNQEDSDGNGIGDACQDIDADGLVDIADNCPRIYNPNQEDTDGNGVGDICQDTDEDGIIDIEDNCELTPNPNQSDQNNDGIGDVCETPQPADALTPNGDMQNDGWFIKNIEYVANEVNIFNRNGVKVFEVKDYINNSWKGESNQGGSGLLPVGSYYYIINYVTTKGESKKLTGWIYINY